MLIADGRNTDRVSGVFAESKASRWSMSTRKAHQDLPPLECPLPLTPLRQPQKALLGATNRGLSKTLLERISDDEDKASLSNFALWKGLRGIILLIIHPVQSPRSSVVMIVMWRQWFACRYRCVLHVPI